MSDAEIRRLIRNLFKAIDSREFETILPLLTEHATLMIQGRPAVRGKRKIIVALLNFGQHFKDTKHWGKRFVIKGKDVAIEGVVKATLLDGQVLIAPFANFFEIRNERINQYHIYPGSKR